MDESCLHLLYTNHIKHLIITAFMASFLYVIFTTTLHLQMLHSNLIFLLVSAFTAYYTSRPKSIYLIDFSCFLPPSVLRAPSMAFLEHSSLSGFYQKENIEFQRTILARSGLGEETSLPEALHFLPPRTGLAAATQETTMAIFGAIDELLATTKVNPKEIGVLIVNSSLLTPAPSLSTIVINRYKLRSNIRSFNLSGMGCSAGIISIAAAKDMLQVHNDTYALVVSTENIAQNMYFGNQRSMLVPNCLFRVGAAAILLSNRRKDKRQAKYKLLHLVRTTMAAEDRAYECVIQDTDDAGKTGVHLSKDLTAVAGDALKANISRLGPLVLPYSEQMRFAMNLLVKKVTKGKRSSYIPNFKLAFQHFCIHAGGRAVIDELEKRLSLSQEHVEASRMSLYRFGNTSSSSIWYELAYIEAKGRMKKGDRVWQVGFGSGFKCNSCVWKSMGNILHLSIHHNNNPWKNIISEYPIHIPKINTMCS